MIDEYMKIVDIRSSKQAARRKRKDAPELATASAAKAVPAKVHVPDAKAASSSTTNTVVTAVPATTVPVVTTVPNTAVPAVPIPLIKPAWTVRPVVVKPADKATATKAPTPVKATTQMKSTTNPLALAAPKPVAKPVTTQLKWTTTKSVGDRLVLAIKRAFQDAARDMQKTEAEFSEEFIDILKRLTTPAGFRMLKS